MKQEPDLLAALRAELDRADRLRLSAFRLAREASLPVNLATIYRWRKGERAPVLPRIQATVATLREFLDREEARFARGLHTRGGALVLDEEMRTVRRDGVTIGLKGQEFELLAALKSATRAVRRDWICEAYDIPPKSFDRALSMLREKIGRIDLEIVRRITADGEPAAYALSDLAGGAEAAA